MQKYAHLVELEKCCKTDAYFLAKFRFDTAENEHAKKLQLKKNASFAKRAVGPQVANPLLGELNGKIKGGEVAGLSSGRFKADTREPSCVR